MALSIAEKDTQAHFFSWERPAAGFFYPKPNVSCPRKTVELSDSVILVLNQNLL